MSGKGWLMGLALALGLLALAGFGLWRSRCLSKPFAQGGAVRGRLVRFLRDATAPATASKPTASVPVQRQTR